MSRSATWTSTASPALWPQLSLTSLKRSRSRNITTGNGVRFRRARAMPWRRRSTSKRRFGKARERIVQDLVRQLGLGQLLLQARWHRPS